MQAQSVNVTLQGVSLKEFKDGLKGLFGTKVKVQQEPKQRSRPDLDEAISQYERGEVIRFDSFEEMMKYLDSDEQ